jgi:hypothetical protein
MCEKYRTLSRHTRRTTVPIIGVTATTHSSGTLGSVQGDATREITAKGGEVLHSDAFSGAIYDDHSYNNWTNYGGHNYISGFFSFAASRIVPVANENRPINTAVRYLIRALP